MQPLSPQRRRFYLVGLMLLFVVLLPIVIFYADGYRYKLGIGFRQTGGIFLSVPYADATVTLNGELLGRSGFLQRSLYIDNLTTGTYTIIAEREGSVTWIRALFVEPQLVTDARVLLVPIRFEARQLIAGRSVATSTRTLLPAEFAAMQAAFRTEAPTTSAASALSETLFIEDGDVFDRQVRSDSLPTSNFCSQPSYCVLEILVERGEDTATAAAFFREGVVYSTKERGVFFAEVDIRPTPVVVQLYARPGAEFRVINDTLVVKDGSVFYEIVGL